MKLRLLAGAAAGLAAALTFTAPAHAARVLDFSGACGGAAACSIGQDYGDDAQVDMSYRTFNLATGETLEDSLRFAQSGFGDLEGAAYGGSSDEDVYAEIVFKAAEGFELSLASFDFAGLLQRTRAYFEIFALDGAPIAAAAYRTPAGHGNASFEDAYRDGVILRWRPSADIAVDNISFDVRPVASAVPEPASWALMIAGFGLVGGAIRRRRERFAVA